MHLLDGAVELGFMRLSLVELWRPVSLLWWSLKHLQYFNCTEFHQMFVLHLFSTSASVTVQVNIVIYSAVKEALWPAAATLKHWCVNNSNIDRSNFIRLNYTVDHLQILNFYSNEIPNVGCKLVTKSFQAASSSPTDAYFYVKVNPVFSFSESMMLHRCAALFNKIYTVRCKRLKRCVWCFPACCEGPC